MGKENAPNRHDIEISNVHEVSLRGRADLGYWRRVLKEYRLAPGNVGGFASIVVSAAQLKFKGIPFRELSISVALAPRSGKGSFDDYYLVHAFNSVRLFAFVERRRFHTPYHHGRIELEYGVPAHIEVGHGQEILLRAEMAKLVAAPARKPVRDEDEEVRLRVYLPGRGAQRMFHARLAGRTQVYPFLRDDSITLRASDKAPVLRQLLDSKFSPSEWSIRGSAVHGKSATLSERPLKGN